jgi:hypothetical protein
MKKQRKMYSLLLIGGVAAIIGIVPIRSCGAEGVNEECAAQLKKMAAYLESQAAFSFEAVMNDEKVTSDGEIIPITRNGKGSMKRPNKLWMEAQQGEESRTLWYDGTQLTLFDPVRKLYATAKAPDTVDAALDFAMDELGFTMPLADFVFFNLYDNFTAQVTESAYLGTDKVEDTLCHQLAFKQDEIDWQMWIQDGDMPLPRKLRIVYKKVPGEPKFTITFTKWEFSEELPDDKFNAVLPDDAGAIDFLRTEAA